MTDSEAVRKLADLARLEIPEERQQKLVAEFDAILEYVGQLEELDASESGEFLPYANTLRKDGEPTPAGTWTKQIVAQFPEKEGNSLSVKQIISHD